jgi:hypothetical protein
MAAPVEAARLLGQRVELRGLEARPELNGARGLALDFDDVAQRYVVALDAQGGKKGNVRLKPTSLFEAAGEPAWRAADVMDHDGVDVVTPLADPARAAALAVDGRSSVRLTGPPTPVRTVATFLATPRDAACCVRWRVCGEAALGVKLCQRDSKIGLELGGLRDGSEVCVALLSREGSGYNSDVWYQVYVDGEPKGEPKGQPRSYFELSFAQETRVAGGVEVVARYHTGSEAEQLGFRRWQGVYLIAELTSRRAPGSDPPP